MSLVADNVNKKCNSTRIPFLAYDSTTSVSSEIEVEYFVFYKKRPSRTAANTASYSLFSIRPNNFSKVDLSCFTMIHRHLFKQHVNLLIRSRSFQLPRYGGDLHEAEAMKEANPRHASTKKHIGTLSSIPRPFAERVY